MNTSTPSRSRLLAAAALLPATAAVVLTSWSLSRPAATAADALGSSSAATPSSPVVPATGDTPGSGRIVLGLPDGLATATLDDTPVARDFAAQLPLDLTLLDPMGQAKSGQLPRRLDVAGAERVTDPRVGVVYYWPPSGDIAVFYDDLGQAVPSPGLVRLGTLDGGLDVIGSAGHRFTMSIHRE